MRSLSCRTTLLPFLLAAALVLGAAVLPFPAYAEEEPASGDVPAVDDGNSGDTVTEKLDEISGKLDVIADAIPEAASSGSDSALTPQVLADFFFVKCACAVLLALDLGALCWLCFRVR